ncbi:hypothetical protein [Rothia sp. P4278]|uniref:DUF7946 domain-containing protein n=1 Tax=Rothia sp. P4278 TaxID=3402658 RepID=UPI003AE051F4
MDSIPTEEVLQLRFTGSEANDHQLSAWELAQTLEGVAGFIEEMLQVSSQGEMVNDPVKVRPLQEGSVAIEFVVNIANWVAANPEGALATISTGGGISLTSIRAGMNIAKHGLAEDFEYQEHNDTYKVKWRAGFSEEVPAKAWEALQKEKKKTRKNLQKILEPIGNSAQQLEMRTADTATDSAKLMQEPAAVTYDQEDYRAVSYDYDEEVVHKRTFTAEASFTTLDFRPGKKWRVRSTQGNRLATMADDGFQKQIDEGLKIGADDLFEITVFEETTEKGGRTSIEWTIVQVRRTKIGDAPPIN